MTGNAIDQPLTPDQRSRRKPGRIAERLADVFSKRCERARAERPVSLFHIDLEVRGKDDQVVSMVRRGRFRFRVQSPSGLRSVLSGLLRRIKDAIRWLEREVDALSQATVQGRLTEEMEALACRVLAKTASLVEWLLPTVRRLASWGGLTIHDLIASLFLPSVFTAGGGPGSFVTRC